MLHKEFGVYTNKSFSYNQIMDRSKASINNSKYN